MTFTAPDRAALSRVLAVANGKGGVGKTSLSTHTAGLLAAQGQRVLLVDLDPQGNAGTDLGYNAAGLSDDGMSLARAVQFGDPLEVVHDVRPGLDVIPGGNRLDELSDVLGGVSQRSGEKVELRLAIALSGIAGEYGLTILDCPPRHAVLQKAALAAAAYLVIPTKTDVASLNGLEEMARRFADALQVNPGLDLLGVLMFGVTSQAKTIREAARAWIETALGAQAPVLKASIRHVEGPAVHIRSRGQLAHELELGAEASVPAAMAKAAAGLAGDYEKAVGEMLTLLLAKEAASV